MRQTLVFEKDSILEETTLGLPKGQKDQFYKAEKILLGLGFLESDFERDPYSFSGGYQIRINLAKLLISEPNLILLDEPTNYLDIVSLIWLRKFLKGFSGEVIIITHDRYFMDSITTHTMGIHRGFLKKIKGKTDKYYSQVLMEEEVYEQTRLNQEKKKKELAIFIDRFRAKASKSSQAQSRIKQLNKMADLEKLNRESHLGFSFRYKECPGKHPLEIKNLSFGYTKEEILFQGLNCSIGRHDCIGIIGKNGKGKSTLLNILAGNLDPLEGVIRYHPLAVTGYLGQTNIERLYSENSIVQEISNFNTDLSYTEVRKIAGAMMFSGDDADKLIKVLSGGEKARVMLAKLLAKHVNILLLDEPTNHLDMDSVETLCDELKKFEGIIMLVTHSEMLLRKLAKKIIIFKKGGAQFFDGGYDDFLVKVGWDSNVVKGNKIKNNDMPGKGNKKSKIKI